MFKFSTLNFINSAKYLDGITEKFVVKTGTKSGKKELQINSNRLVFTEDTLKEAYVRKGDYGQLEEATVSATVSSDKTYQLVIWVKLAQASVDSLYANDFVIKGKPLTIEVDGATLSNNAKFQKFMKKYQLAMYDGEMVKVVVSGNNITVKATNIYQRFQKVELSEWDDTVVDPLNTKWKHVAGGSRDEVESLITTHGREDFGTYHQLTKDMVLPTSEHLAWGANQADERPVPGVLYDQYTLHMCAPRQHTGLGAVGEAIESKTTHVFYVAKSVSTTFAAKVTEIVGQNNLVEICEGGKVNLAQNEEPNQDNFEPTDDTYSNALN